MSLLALAGEDVPEEIIDSLKSLVDKECGIKDFYELAESLIGSDINIYFPAIRRHLS